MTVVRRALGEKAVEKSASVQGMQLATESLASAAVPQGTWVQIAKRAVVRVDGVLTVGAFVDASTELLATR